MTDRPADRRRHQRPLYIAPKMTSFSEEEVAAGLGPVMLSGPQTLGPDAGFSADRSRERDLGSTITDP